MVSVVIPLYNKERTIRRCVRSVLNQTYKDLEILIVDDGSTDKSIKQLATFSDSRIKIIKTHHQGVSVARNIGIRQSLGEFVALIDADDEWDLEFLETLLSLSEKYPQASVFISRYRFCDNEGISLDAVIRGLNYANDGIVYDYFKIASDSNPPICSSNILAYKWVFEDAGFFPNEI